MSIEWGLPTVCDILKGAVILIKRPVQYATSSKSFADGLQEEVGKLVEQVDRVNALAERARNNVRSFHRTFTTWEASAEKALTEARNLLDAFDEASKTCCYGTLPDPYCRYQFSTKAEAEIEVIRELAQQCIEFKELNDISFINTASGNVTAPTPVRGDGKDAVQSTTATASVFSASTSIKLGNDDVFESRALMIRNIMDALADNSNSVVGVYGMGGMGKSTLLVDVERKIREGKSFDWVAKADVSENPDIKMIQGEIADALGLTEIREKESIGGRARLLHKRLKYEEREKKKVLIILDNLWKGLELNKVGIPCGHDNRVIGCKLLLTSRDRNVLRSEMSCDKDFPLGELEEDEARSLFQRLVGDKVHDDKFKLLMDEALHKCFGMPFLIVHMAKFFKHADLPEWKSVLKQIKLSKNERIGEVINERLQLSYTNLNVAQKSLLVLCVACGTSRPSFENLVRYGVGYGLFQEDDNMEEARESLKSGICSLQASSLLLEDGDAFSFKIHDLVHEFVASVALRDHPLLVLKDKDKSIIELSKDKLKRCRAVCFPYDDMKELPQELDCPELQIFLLFTNNKSLEVPYSLFCSMRKLMVLNLTGICFTCPPSLPFQFLENLYTLCLDGCSLDNVAALGELKQLQILSFANSNIHRLPREIGQLKELRLLDLNHCLQLEIIEPGVLQSLIKLEELYMQNSFAQWNTMEQTPPTNASLIELNHMKNLFTLHVSIPNPSVLPEDLNVEKLAKYEIRIGNVWHWSNECKGSRTLKLELDPLGDVLRKACIQSILGRTNHLFLDRLDGTEQSICTLSQKGFPELKYLHVKNNPSIHYIFQSPSPTDFKMLESLLLKDLINLEKICHSHISSMSFSTLKVVRVQSCDKMEVLFPLSVVRGLPQLEEVEVVDCKLIRGIVEASDYDKGEFHNLRVLKLLNLPDIKNFSNTRLAPLSSTSDNRISTQIAFFNGQQVSMQSLEYLTMERLPNLKEISSDESPVELSNLQSLRVVQCESLLKIINSRLLIKLHKLHTLYIEDCNSVQEIFDIDGPSTIGDVETSSELTSLELYKLHSLRCIWNNNPNGIMSFQNLMELKVINCPNLRFIINSRLLIKLHKLHTLYIKDCNSVQEIFDIDRPSTIGDVETLSELTSLELYKLHSLRCIWNNNPSGIMSFQNLMELKVHNCPNLRFMFFPSMVESLVQLRQLDIAYCKKMEAIIVEEEGLGLETSETLSFIMLNTIGLHFLESLKCFSLEKYSPEVRNQDCVKSRSTALFSRQVAFPNLDFLCIGGMNNIEMIWDDRVAVDSFSKLKGLEVYKCDKLLNVIPSFLLGHLLSLDCLMVTSCASLKVVFEFQPHNPLDGHPVARSPLKELQLLNLPELKCVWDKKLHRQVKFQCLRSISICKCQSLTSLFPASITRDLIQLEKLQIKICGITELIEKEVLEELSTNVEAIEGASHELKVILPFTSYFQHLKTLDMSCHDGLSNMFTPTMARNLVALTKLRIKKCRMLTEVISDEGGREEHVVAFNQLKYMELEGLTRLRCFSSGRYTLMFPLLEDVIVTRCFNMNFFHKGTIGAPKLKRVEVSRNAAVETAWFWKENLNITIQNMFEEMVEVDALKFMRLSEFPKLIEKWHSELNPIKSSWQLESLVVDKCPSFANVIPSKLMLELENLSTLQVHDCQSLEEIFDLKGVEAMESTRVLPSIMTLHLVNLPKLRQLWNKDLQGSLPYNFLSYITLYKCSNLKHAFVASMVQCLANLEGMEIKECGQMEGVVTDEERQGSAVDQITFPNLIYLNMECLPNLTSFLLGNNYMLECPKLEELTIAHCPKMRSLTWQSLMEIDHGIHLLFTPQVQFPGLQSIVLSHVDNLNKIWTDNPLETLTFEDLWKVKVENCKSLKYLFPHWVATSLNQLKKLRVEFCAMDEIVMSGDDNPHSTTAQVLFPKLTSLVLHDMPQLKSFNPNLSTLNWPFLKKLRVTHCDKLNMPSFVASINNWTQRDDQPDISSQEAHSSFERDFLNLKRLLLVDKDIQMTLDGKFIDDIFGKTKAITLACFHDEKVVFPLRFLIERFQNLKSLEVFCSSFEAIFPDEGLANEGSVLENVRELKLNKLLNLKHLWREDYLATKILRSLKKFEVLDCPCLTTLSPAMTSFQNLKKLVVKNSGLVHVLTISMVTNLAHLTNLTVIGCDRIKEIVTGDGNRKSREISFRKLRTLRLQHLPSLVCFSSITCCDFYFGDLETIIVEECPEMKFFSKCKPYASCVEHVNLFGYKWEPNWEIGPTMCQQKPNGEFVEIKCKRKWEGGFDDLNTAIQELSA